MNRPSELHIEPSRSETDRCFMARALQIARLGEGLVSPNPMVGAVVVSPTGKIIGEGYHHRYGGPHAEVNAIASVSEADRPLLKESTIYVTLEPCSHYGKTPPCAKLLVDTGLKRVVVGALDPFPQVAGRGIAMLREAGIEVETGVLKEECEYLNRRFMTAHRLGRPWIELKWAESADGCLGLKDGRPVALSTGLTLPLMHRERSLVDAIMVGSRTLHGDNPRLDCRRWPGRPPRPVIFAPVGADLNGPQAEITERGLREGWLPEGSPLAERDPIWLEPHAPLVPQMERLYKEYGITSLLVEGGAELLRSFLREELADEIRIERSPRTLGAEGGASL